MRFSELSFLEPTAVWQNKLLRHLYTKVTIISLKTECLEKISRSQVSIKYKCMYYTAFKCCKFNNLVVNRFLKTLLKFMHFMV